jgi:hypothetical protein
MDRRRGHPPSFELLVKLFGMTSRDLIDPDPLGHELFEVRHHLLPNRNRGWFAACPMAVSPTQYYTWKKLLVSSAEAVFGGKRQRSQEVKESRLEADLTRMKNVIAEITAENLELKKTL